MSLKKEDILARLSESGIEYNNIDHPAVYTIEEMLQVGLPDTDRVAKNLFLRDDKKHYYLLTVPEDRKVNMKELRSILSSRPLSFARPEELDSVLGVISGAVTPFGLLNDGEKRVTMVFDNYFRGGLIGVHPVDNTATVFLGFEDLVGVVAPFAKEVVFIDL
ncbi:MAG: prolyl-tRNA synthetase associated domain-containing protein [Oscillospiraceae bacterium]|nr:prolyl-tRNA synthetase associated domain-containing protein [Oscillospiraceae bacterium]